MGNSNNNKIIIFYLGDRVQWFRAQADSDMERWQEEVEILEEEFRRAIRGFEKMEQVWSSLAMSKGPDSEAAESDFDSRVAKGKMAYGKKKAAMYGRMAKEAHMVFLSIGATYPPEGVSLGDHIRSQRPSQEIDWTSAV
jgi:hypothetical protein